MLTIAEIQGKLSPIFEKNKVKQAVLFGSYATGVATENSDVDLFIDDDNRIRGLMLFGVRSEIEEVLNRDVDLVVKREITPNSRIDEEIRNKGMVIYG